jgi:MSHA biogenesis protein MshN
MSVLNTMLRDLERRGARLQTTLPPLDAHLLEATLPVAGTRRRAGGLLALMVVVVAAGSCVWYFMLRPSPASPRPASVTVAPPPVAPIVASAPEPRHADVPGPSDSSPPLVVAVAPPVLGGARHQATSTLAPVSPVLGALPEHPHTLTPPRNEVSSAVAAAVVQAKESGPTATKAPLASAPPALPVSISTPQSELAAVNELISKGRSLDAERLLQSVLAEQPRMHEARFTLASLQAERGDRPTALKTLSDGAAVEPARFAQTTAQLQAELGDLNGALQTLDHVPASSRTGSYHALLAAIDQRLGRHADAVEQYALALRAEPSRESAWVGMGVSLQALGQNAQARQAFEQALKGDLTPVLQRFAQERLSSLPDVADQSAHR